MQAGRIVEIGDKRALLDAPRHPYTQKLIASVPPAEPRASFGHEAQCPSPSLGISHLAKTYRIGGQSVTALMDASLTLDKGRTPRHRRQIGIQQINTRAGRDQAHSRRSRRRTRTGGVDLAEARRQGAQPGRGARYR